MEYCVQMWIKRKQLEAVGGFKKSILDEMTEAIDAKAAVRQYLESLSSIHCLARETIDSFVSDARKAIDEAYARYAAFSSDSCIGLTAFRVEDGNSSEKFPLVREWDDVRLALQEKNPRLVNLQKQYVTGRSSEDPVPQWGGA